MKTFHNRVILTSTNVINTYTYSETFCFSVAANKITTYRCKNGFELMSDISSVHVSKICCCKEMYPNLAVFCLVHLHLKDDCTFDYKTYQDTHLYFALFIIILMYSQSPIIIPHIINKSKERKTRGAS